MAYPQLTNLKTLVITTMRNRFFEALLSKLSQLFHITVESQYPPTLPQKSSHDKQNFFAKTDLREFSHQNEEHSETFNVWLYTEKFWEIKFTFIRVKRTFSERRVVLGKIHLRLYIIQSSFSVFIILYVFTHWEFSQSRESCRSPSCYLLLRIALLRRHLIDVFSPTKTKL